MKGPEKSAQPGHIPATAQSNEESIDQTHIGQVQKEVERVESHGVLAPDRPLEGEGNGPEGPILALDPWEVVGPIVRGKEKGDMAELMDPRILFNKSMVIPDKAVGEASCIDQERDAQKKDPGEEPEHVCLWKHGVGSSAPLGHPNSPRR
jgi:hypothetical protein